MRFSGPFRLGIFGRLIIPILLTGLVPVGLLGVFGISKSLEMYQDNFIKSLKSRTDWQVESINKNFHSIIGHLYFLSELPSLKRHLDGKSQSASELESDIMEFSRGHRHYGKIRVIDVSGREVTRVNNKNGKLFLASDRELEFVGNSARFRKSLDLSKGDVIILPMEVDTSRDFLSQRIVEVVTPVYRDKTKLGIIMAQLYAFELLEWIHLPDAPFLTLLLDSKGNIFHLHEHISGVGFQKEVVAGDNISELFPPTNSGGDKPVQEGLSYIDEGAIVIRPIHLNNDKGPSWFIATFFPKSYLAGYAATLKWYLAVGIMLVTLAAILTAIYLTRRFKKSFHALNKGMENIAAGNFDERLKLESGDEFEDAADKMEQMRLRLKKEHDELVNRNREFKDRLDYYRRELHGLEHQLHRADKLASVGELSLKLANEIGSPLASIKTVTRILSERINGNGADREYYDKIAAEADRLTLFMKEFNGFAVMKEQQMAACDLGAIVRDVNFFLKVQAVEKGVSIEENLGDGPVLISADVRQIKQLLMNLILNAIQATDATGVIRITLKDSGESCGCRLRGDCFCEGERPGAGKKNFCELSICDTGKGIGKSDLSEIFNPFFTTKPNGAGIGLSIAKKTVESHNGSISVYSAEGEGTTFRVYFPKYEESRVGREKDAMGILGQSDAVKHVRDQIYQVAQASSTPVLIFGESGTGKELVADAIHKASARRDKPMMALNCSAIPDTLLESELFGYEKGAFTDAKQVKKGIFEMADKGTIFLDEIGDLALSLQPKLLRVLETGIVRRVGGTKDIHLDVRVISATNQDLREKIKKGMFRSDLLYRLNVFTIHLPPLRERAVDITLLAAHFLKIANKTLNKNIDRINGRVMEKFKSYSWPGNVRELKNVIERACILSKNGVINEKDCGLDPSHSGMAPMDKIPVFTVYNSWLPLHEVELQYIQSLLKRCNDNKSEAARQLGISRVTLREKIRQGNNSKPK